MSAAERMRRYRLRKAGRFDGVGRACLDCGASLSRFAEATERLCWSCGKGRGPVCTRGHDLEAHGRIAWRGTRQTLECGACKRHRERGYSEQRRVSADSA